MTPTLRAAAAAALLLAPPALRAQEPPAAPAAPTAPDTAGVQLRAGTWTYASTLTVQGRKQGAGKRTITIAPATERGAQAWLIVDVQDQGGGKATDSLVVARSDLSSLRRVTRLAGPMGEMTLTAEFTPDSVKGEIVAGDQRQPIAVANVPGAISGDAAVVAALPVLPLAQGWKAAFNVLSPQTGRATPLTVSVVGEETVQVPAGRFETWIVEAEAGQARATYWVAKRGPVVMVTATAPQMGEAVVETVLERARPAR